MYRISTPMALDAILSESRNTQHQFSCNSGRKVPSVSTRRSVYRKRLISSNSGGTGSDDVPSPAKMTLEDILSEGEFDMIDDLVSKCNKTDQNLQKKMDYYYGAYGQYQDCQPILPLSFENGASYQENASVKWGALAKIILHDNSQSCKDLIKSVAGDIYAKLKELSHKLQKPKFQKILTFVDDLLRKEMESWENDRGVKSESEDEKQLRSLITLLFMIKKGKLEEVVYGKKKTSKRRFKSNDRRSSGRTMFVNSTNRIPKLQKYSRYFPNGECRPDIKEIKSSKIVPALPLMNKTTANWFIPLSEKSKISKPQKARKLTEDASTVISLDSMANDEIDWACTQLEKVKTSREIRTKSVPKKISPSTSNSKVSKTRNRAMGKKSLSSIIYETKREEGPQLNTKIPKKKFINMSKIKVYPHWKPLASYI